MKQIYSAVSDVFEVKVSTSLTKLLGKIDFYTTDYTDSEGTYITEKIIRKNLKCVSIDLYHRNAQYDWVYRIRSHA